MKNLLDTVLSRVRFFAEFILSEAEVLRVIIPFPVTLSQSSERSEEAGEGSPIGT